MASGTSRSLNETVKLPTFWFFVKTTEMGAVVVVAHRPSLVAGADEIVTLEPAAVVA